MPAVVQRNTEKHSMLRTKLTVLAGVALCVCLHLGYRIHHSATKELTAEVHNTDHQIVQYFPGKTLIPAFMCMPLETIHPLLTPLQTKHMQWNW